MHQRPRSHEGSSRTCAGKVFTWATLDGDKNHGVAPIPSPFNVPPETALPGNTTRPLSSNQTTCLRSQNMEFERLGSSGPEPMEAGDLPHSVPSDERIYSRSTGLGKTNGKSSTTGKMSSATEGRTRMARETTWTVPKGGGRLRRNGTFHPMPAKQDPSLPPWTHQVFACCCCSNCRRCFNLTAA